MQRDTHALGRRAFLRAAGVAGAIGLAGCAADESLGESQGNGGSGDGSGGGAAEWTLGTSSEGSSSFRIGSNFAEFLKREGYTDTVTLDAVVTPGTSATYRMVDNKEVEIGGTTTQLLENSPDKGSFEDEPLKNFDSIRQVRGYMSFYNFALANTEAGVESWSDLEGSAIAISSPGSATRPAAEWVVDQEIGLDSVDPRYMAFADIPSALRGGRVDAAFTWATNGTLPQGWFQEIDSTVNWAPLPLSKGTKSKLSSDVAYSSVVEIDGAKISENHDGAIDGFTLTYLWNVLAERDPKVVYEIARLSHEHGEALVEQDDVMGFFPDPDKFLGTIHPDVPVHLGAYQYYKEAGIWGDYDLTKPPEAE
ncbi:TAXI family TRAP transporter solute-binding subunit [Halegenticoccus soli]|uniref:TAXI family TRAP transporter solute-binding subunit n=1 Tax=Halegenticoccus soli TaxID=1985678 RepID=UPI000C6E6F6B|nr:TAXI family TRAP transporter solute-binding subunit [Halegenticoccus soli]